MQIVPATRADAHAVAQIHVDSWRVAYRDILAADYLASLSVEEREAMWRDAIASGRPALLVAKDDDDGGVRGWVSFAGCRDAGAPETQAESGRSTWRRMPGRWASGACCGRGRGA